MHTKRYWGCVARITLIATLTARSVAAGQSAVPGQPAQSRPLGHDGAMPMPMPMPMPMDEGRTARPPAGGGGRPMPRPMPGSPEPNEARTPPVDTPMAMPMPSPPGPRPPSRSAEGRLAPAAVVPGTAMVNLEEMALRTNPTLVQAQAQV